MENSWLAFVILALGVMLGPVILLFKPFFIKLLGANQTKWEKEQKALAKELKINLEQVGKDIDHETNQQVIDRVNDITSHEPPDNK